jgi:hypothetical protein
MSKKDLYFSQYTDKILEYEGMKRAIIYSITNNKSPWGVTGDFENSPDEITELIEIFENNNNEVKFEEKKYHIKRIEKNIYFGEETEEKLTFVCFQTKRAIIISFYSEIESEEALSNITEVGEFLVQSGY